MPFSPFYFALLLVALGLLAVFVQVGALTLAFDKLGLSPNSATLLLFTSLLGSLINLPLFSVKAEGPPPNPLMVFGAVAMVAAVCRLASRPMPGVGIGIPIFIAPLAAAMASLIIDPQHSAPLAYISGTLGVLIGADISRINDIRKMGAPFASIGGAGTFDGIFLSGIVAVLLT